MRISRRKFKPKVQPTIYLVNELIRSPQVRLIGENGEHIGLISTSEALAKARTAELDLVVIQAKAEPPVAKIVDFGKYKYEQDKEMQKQKAKQKSVEIKGVRLSARISDHDMNVRKEQAKKFLEQGDKIKVEIILRGREKSHADLGMDNIRHFVDMINAEIPIKIEQPIARQGGQLTTILAKA
jgi:translation initiation factor IF-3